MSADITLRKTEQLTKNGVGVLEVGDEDKPVVDPEVRDDVHDKHLREGALVRPVSEGGEVEEDTNVRHDDLHPVLGLEDDRFGVEVWRLGLLEKLDWEQRLTVGALGVVLLACSVADEVRREPEELLENRVEEGREWGLLDGLTELVLAESRDAVCQYWYLRAV